MERGTRIARELHDTLLQSFQGLLLRFQSVLKEYLSRTPTGSQAKTRRARSIRRRLGEAIAEGRDAVQGFAVVGLGEDQ